MCIAIYKPTSRYLDDETIKNSFYNNPDGAGFAAWSPKIGLVVEKGLMTYREFMEAYEPFSGKADNAETKALLHFRIATHGEISKENTHPFVIDRTDGYRVAVIHNGMLPINVPCKVRSDTAFFVEDVLSPLIQKDPLLWMDGDFQAMVEKFITGSKLIFMDSLGNHRIYNEKAGDFNDEVWYSNRSYNYSYGRSYGAYAWGDGDGETGYYGADGKWKSDRDYLYDESTTGRAITSPKSRWEQYVNCDWETLSDDEKADLLAFPPDPDETTDIARSQRQAELDSAFDAVRLELAEELEETPVNEPYPFSAGSKSSVRGIPHRPAGERKFKITDRRRFNKEVSNEDLATVQRYLLPATTSGGDSPEEWGVGAIQH